LYIASLLACNGTTNIDSSDYNPVALSIEFSVVSYLQSNSLDKPYATPVSSMAGPKVPIIAPAAMPPPTVPPMVGNPKQNPELLHSK
jgi:hypothetical protein